jgi:CheY-like chemotaxis protein
MVQLMPKSGATGVQPRSMRVLVVDDQPTATMVLATLLSKRGFETCAVNDSRQVLRAAREFEPEIILLDIAMPYMDGYEVARRIRRDPNLKDTPIIAVTAFSHAEHNRRAEAAGIEYQLRKPCDLESLMALMEWVVRKPADQHL